MKLTKQQVAAELSRRHLIHFAQYTTPQLSLTQFHRTYYHILNEFATGNIKRLIISVPPQHGKSQGSSILLPAYLLGLNPDAKIAVSSYNLSLASRFNRRIQQLMSSASYRNAFHETKLPERGAKAENRVRNNTEFDIAGHNGGLIAVGREGSLTGNQVDIFILDDLYKDAMEANSPIIRNNVWEWYNSVVKTRLHNNSQELIVFTRWHEDDLIGRIEAREKVIELTDHTQIFTTKPDNNVWFKLNFEAIKRSPLSPIDPRRDGESLWEDRHSAELLKSKRLLDPVMFEAMYQGNPSTQEGLLYGDNFATYDTLPPDTVKRANYTDTADTGEDFLCSICYEVGRNGNIYITDVVYTQQSMDETEPLVAEMLTRCNTSIARIESNNGGRGFARSLSKMTDAVRIEWFHQSRNKEARILSNATTALRQIYFPEGWQSKWTRLHSDLARYRRIYKANRWHDAADVITGIIETENDTRSRNIKAVGFI